MFSPIPNGHLNLQNQVGRSCAYFGDYQMLSQLMSSDSSRYKDRRRLSDELLLTQGIVLTTGVGAFVGEFGPELLLAQGIPLVDFRLGSHVF